MLDSLRPGWFGLAQQLECVAVVAKHTLIDAALVGVDTVITFAGCPGETVMAALDARGIRVLLDLVNDLLDLASGKVQAKATDRRRLAVNATVASAGGSSGSPSA